MRKLMAVVNVIAWMGFWAFGYIALTSTELDGRKITIAAMLAGVGFLIGVYAYLKLSKGRPLNNDAMTFRHSEEEAK